MAAEVPLSRRERAAVDVDSAHQNVHVQCATVRVPVV